MITANPYVYPTKDFQNLTNTTVRWEPVLGAALSLSRAAELVRPFLRLPPHVLASKTPEENLLELFDARSVCFGASPLGERDRWLELFRRGRKRGVLPFTIFGFPFKIPVPLKTDRIGPDAGELASLLRLAGLMERIEEISGVDTRLTVFAEDVFADAVGVLREDAERYFELLARIVSLPVISSRVSLVPMSGMQRDPRFEGVFRRNVELNLERHISGDPSYLEQFEGVRLPVFRILATRGYAAEVLAEVYGESEDGWLSVDARALREELRDRLPEAAAKYFGYLMTRDELGYIESIVPDSIPLSVSPKPGRLGIFPVHPDIDVLPYHGVPVIDRGVFDIAYRFDLQRQQRTYTLYPLEGDGDTRGAFLYEPN